MLHIDNKNISFKLDTGADVNVLPLNYLKILGYHENSLIPSSLKLQSYSGNNISVIGKCNLKTKYKNNIYIINFIVVNTRSCPILGKYSCEELNLIKRVNCINEQINDHPLFHEFSDIFEGIGCLPGEYKIELQSNAHPVVHAPRKLPLVLKEQVKSKLEEMQKQGIIAKVEGPTDWVSSMTVVKKANGDLRICLDPKDLNDAIKREHFKLPTLDEITSNLSGAKYFSTLDAKQGFWQIKLNKESSNLCTFNTVFGRFKFLRMPYGISSASEIFHKRLYEHFDDLEGVILFVDDLLVYSKTKEEHDKRLRDVLQRCREINIKLNRQKCKICLTEIKYLGHKISQSGICPDESHTSAIRNMPTPKNTKDLERFLGLITYVGKFIKNLSDKTYPLRELLKKDVHWHWEDRHEQCFNTLKQCLSNPPTLQYYSLDKPITISVDASKNGLGACLMQDGLPVCYASKSLTKTEQSYAQIEKELYACVFACEKFYMYIYGRNDVSIETDHKPLVNIIKKPLVSTPVRLQRMLLRLQPYTFNLIYKPGKYLYIADALSRAAETGAAAAGGAEPRDGLDVQAQVCAVFASNPLTDTHFLSIQKCTKTDSELQDLKKIILEGWPVHKSKVKDNLRQYWQYRSELIVAYDIIWRDDRVLIPKCLRQEMLKRIHAAHLGVTKCELRAREIMFWPNMNAQIKDYLSHCQACLTYKKQNVKEPLMQHEVPTRAWARVGIDIFHFGHKTYLLIVDYYSKFIEVRKIKSLSSNSVIKKLKKVFRHQGIPETIVSDNGPEFSSNEFKNFSKEWSFHHVTSSPRNPQSNGQVERAIQTVKMMLKKTNFDSTDFNIALLEYLNTPISDVIPSPAEILNNRKLRSIVPCNPTFLKPSAQVDIDNKLKVRQRQQKHYYDRNARKLKPIQIGQKVKVRIDTNWVNGIIYGVVSPRSYLIKMYTGRILRRNRRHIIVDSVKRNDDKDARTDYDDIPYTLQTSNQIPRQSSGSCGPISQSNNKIITRFGRTVNPPDRWTCPITQKHRK